MTTLPMTYVIRSIVRFARTKPIRATGPAQLHPALTDHAKFVICDHTIEQDHRGVKRITRPMLGFKAFHTARRTLVWIELIHMLRKDQWADGVEQGLTAAEQCYSLAA